MWLPSILSIVSSTYSQLLLWTLFEFSLYTRYSTVVEVVSVVVFVATAVVVSSVVLVATEVSGVATSTQIVCSGAVVSGILSLTSEQPQKPQKNAIAATIIKNFFI